MLLKPTIEAALYDALSELLCAGITQANYVDSNGDVDVSAYTSAVSSAQNRARTAAAKMASAVDTYIRAMTITTTIIPMSIVTAGSPASQAGPPAPLPLQGVIS